MYKILSNKEAYDAGGYRERYAMEHGEKEVKNVSGHRLWIFRYSPDDPYQDANGATYDLKERRWVN